MSENLNQPLVEVKNLKEYFNINVGMFKSKPLKAVDDVSFAIKKGETLGLVGESGCGKTTVGRTLLHLYKPTGGEIVYNGKAIKTKEDINEFRKKATMVFQDPYSSLNPSFTIYQSLADPLKHFGVTNKKNQRALIADILEAVNMRPEYMDRYPHEFSGGMKRRVAILRAILAPSEIILMDEPFTGLDADTRQLTIDMVKEFCAGKLLIIATHSEDAAELLGAKIIHL